MLLVSAVEQSASAIRIHIRICIYVCILYIIRIYNPLFFGFSSHLSHQRALGSLKN